MSIVNQSKPSSSITNIVQPNRGTSWDDNLTAWQNENRSWDETGEIMDNVSRPSSSITNQAKP